MEKLYLNDKIYIKVGEEAKKVISKLKKYLEFLSGKKEIYFKTDDYNFFEESREYFREIGFKEEIITHNLQKDDIYLKKAGIKNIITEHEKMFLDKGIFINAGIFVYDNI